MTQLNTHFGIEVTFPNNIDVATYQMIEQVLKSHLAGQKLSDKTDIYIQKMEIVIEDPHFHVKGIENRLGQLDVNVFVGSRSTHKIRFLDLACQINPDINVIRKEHSLKYSLTGKYISGSRNYTDYIAIEVLKSWRNKRLEVDFLAHATPTYAPRMRNTQGKTNTASHFKLTPSVQFQLI